MDNVSLMEVLESVGDLISNVVYHLRLKLPFSNILEVAASHYFLDNTKVMLVLKNIKNAHNTRMICVVKDVHFRLQSQLSVSILQRFFLHHLASEDLVSRGIFESALVHLTVSTLAKHLA
jgi:hypothetical protein